MENARSSEFESQNRAVHGERRISGSVASQCASVILDVIETPDATDNSSFTISYVENAAKFFQTRRRREIPVNSSPCGIRLMLDAGLNDSLCLMNPPLSFLSKNDSS